MSERGAGGERLSAGQPAIPVTVYRSEDRLTVAAPMPGLEPEDITVEVMADDTLSLSGRQRAQLKGVKEVLQEEWTIGPYRRELRLPNPVDGELTNVTYRNGVLVVAMPIARQTRPNRIQMAKVGVAYGERRASAGHPARPAGE